MSEAELESRNQRLRWEKKFKAHDRAVNVSKALSKGQKTFNDIQYIYTKEVINQMNLKELANTITMGNVTDLATIPTDVEVFEEKGVTKEGRPYSFHYIELTGKKYRIPASVLTAIGKLGDDVANVKVTSTGVGMDTRYVVESA